MMFLCDFLAVTKTVTKRWILLPIILCGAISLGQQVRAEENLVEKSGLRGGVILWLGETDAQTLRSVLPNERFRIHGLDRDAERVCQTRNSLLKSGHYGEITVAFLHSDRLPFVDRFINLLIVEDPSGVPMEEIHRVVAPGGVILLRKNDGWKKIEHKWPSSMDDWNHFLHGADNNAVAEDALADLPRSIQWVAAPKTGRSHEELASMSAAVSDNGRVFYVADLAPMATIRFMGDWSLIARDAFNGTFLWKRKIPLWTDHLRHFRSGPVHLPRRLVAADDRVFVTLGLDAPISVLDAATGKTMNVFEGTEFTEEILYENGVLYFVAGTSETIRSGEGLYLRGEPAPTDFRTIGAVDVETGEILWRHAFADFDYLLPMSLTVKNGSVFFQSTQGMGRLDGKTGELLWKTPRSTVARRMSFSAPTIVATDEVLLAADREPSKSSPEAADKGDVVWGVHGWNEKGFARRAPCTLRAYDVETGKELWSTTCSEQYNAAVDVFVRQGQVWVGSDFQAYDLKTGELVKKLDWKGPPVAMPHHRCYRNKANQDYIFTGRSGIEVVSFERGWISNNSWIRGTCQYGIMPANGFLYAPPDACACFNKVKVNGFFAAAARREQAGHWPEDQSRLQKGPAFGESEVVFAQAEDWPMFRNDPMRTGTSSTTIASKPELHWSASLPDGLTQPIVVGEKVFVSSINAHTLYALDADTGNILWHFTADANIDSAPTYWKGSLYFGAADGWLYCVSVKNGLLKWRYLVAPGERFVQAHDRLESLWPVHGSVLIVNDLLYVAAGRNSYLDGGIVLCLLDPKTGKSIARKSICHVDPETNLQSVTEPGRGFDMEGVRPDVLSSDGELLFMKHFAFDLQGDRVEESRPHLFSINSLLESEWFVRSYWLIGTDVGAGWGNWADVAKLVPSGRILCFDEDNVYGYGRKAVASAAVGHRADEYLLWSAEYHRDSVESGNKKREAGSLLWTDDDSLIVRAMTLSPGKLCVAGPPDVGRKTPDLLAFDNPHESLEAFLGKKGVFMRVIDTETGKVLSEHRLPAMPAFDGMIAAQGKVFLSLSDGTVQAWK